MKKLMECPICRQNNRSGASPCTHSWAEASAVQEALLKDGYSTNSQKSIRKNPFGKFLILLASALLVTFLIQFVVDKYFPDEGKEMAQEDAAPTQGSPESEFKCTRTEPYPMPAEIKRALDLRAQRLTEAGFDLDTSFHNCLHIQYGDLRLIGGADGMFSYDNESTANDIAVTIDNVFRFNDDVLMAVVLHHELAHVNLYIGVRQKKISPLSCVDDETNAFWEQINFIRGLNPGEKDSINARVNNYARGKSGNQYSDSMISTIATIYEAGQDKHYGPYLKECNKLPTKAEKDKCQIERERAVIKQILIDNNYCAGRE